MAIFEIGWLETVFLFLALVALGVGFVSVPPEPAIMFARAMFVLAGIVLAAKTAWWGVNSEDNQWIRWGVCIVGSVVACLTVVESIRWTADKAIDLSKYEGELYPASETDPNTAANANGPFANGLAVELGSGVALATQFPHTIIRMAGDEMLTINKDSTTGHIRVTTLQIFDDRKDSIATMDDGHFWVKFGSKKKRPDKSTLVVYDHLNKEVLRVRFLNPHAISVQGLFRHPKRVETIEITKKFLRIGGVSIQKFFFADNAGGDIALQ